MEAPGLHEVKVSASLEALCDTNTRSQGHPIISLVEAHGTLGLQVSRGPSMNPSTPVCSFVTTPAPDEHAQWRRPKGSTSIPALLDGDDPGQTRAERSGVGESISVEVEVWSIKGVRICRCRLNIRLVFMRSTSIISRIEAHLLHLHAGKAINYEGMEGKTLVRIVLITEAMNHAKHPPLRAIVYTTGLCSQTQPSAVDMEERPSYQTICHHHLSG